MTDFPEFRNLDQAADPQAMLSYLDSGSGIAGVKEYKRQSFELLEIASGQTILELGCGTGDDARLIAARVGPTGRVVAVDMSEAAIAEAMKRSAASTASVEFRLGDAHQLSFPSDQFDGTRADRVFQHLEDPVRALRELVRVTRAGGKVVVADPDWGTLVIDSPYRATTEQVVQSKFDMLKNCWMGRQLRAMFLSVGLAQVELRGVVVVFTSLALADELLVLTRAAQEAADVNRITATQATEWIDRLRGADRAGAFLASINSYIVGGRKPSV